MENVIIIGGGPAGLSAAIYLARAGLKPLVFAGSPPGGQLTLTSEVENFPGHESILGAELIEKMKNQAKKFGAVIRDENITSIDLKSSTKLVNSIKTKSLIIATGAKALWLGVPGEERLRGKGVSACATCDGFFFRGKIVAIVGGGDTALEEALTLTKFAKKVYVIHRRDSFRASKIMSARVLSHPQIEVIWNVQVEEIMGEKKVEGIWLINTKSKDDSTKILSRLNSSPESTIGVVKHKVSKNFASSSFQLQLDGIFVAIGHRPDTELFKGKIEMDEKGYIYSSSTVAVAAIKSQILNPKSQTNPKQKILNPKQFKVSDLEFRVFDYNYQTMTSIPGVFAAGDCVDHVYRQASTASGMGVAAALDVERWLEQ